MERCPSCGKWYGKPKAVKVGDDVAFTFTRQKGRRKEICGRVGRLMLIKSDGFSVIYRRTVYHADEVCLPSEPSPLTLSFVGVCEFEGNHDNEGENNA